MNVIKSLQTNYNVFINNRFTRILLSTIAAAGCIKVIIFIFHLKKKRQRLQKSRSLKDIVILHQFPRAKILPNISPFPLKLETYLRMANISYESDFEDFMGPNGKCPYITLNGEDIADSQLAIEFLNKKYNIDLNSDYSDEDIAVGHAFRIMCENFLYWNVAIHRWIYDRNKKIMKISSWPFSLKYVVYPIVNHSIKRSTWYHGIGRHAQKDVTSMGIQDLQSISKFLGTKPFILGEKPCEIDCAVFGVLAQCVWTIQGSVFANLIHGELSNIRDYCYRMKEKFWPDWENCLAI